MAEITEDGYLLKTQNEYFEDETNFYLAIDPLWNLDPSTPDGLKVAHDSEIFGNLDESLQQAYNSKDPNKARDVELDQIGAITGAVRDRGSTSTVSVNLGGVAASVIPAGSRVESEIDGSIWTLNDEVTLNGSGAGSTNATCTVNGATQADAATITKIIDTAPGWQTVTNPGVATPGSNPDTDAEFRIDRSNSVGRPGNNQIDSMTGELLAVDNVTNVRVYENDTGVTDSNGLPPHSIAPVVKGGDDEDCALAIFLKKNPGVAQYQAGTPVDVTVTSPVYSWQQKDIKFSRPIDVDVTVTVDINDSGNLPSDIGDQVIKAILSYVEGELIEAGQGFDQTGFDIAEEVPLSRMYTPVNQVIGQYGTYVNSLLINGGTANVAIAFNEISRFTEANINVIIT
jgi:uncharacterized phage protein gp47/JayE